MKTVYLARQPSTDEGTFGVMSCPDVMFSCFTLEPPWRDNKQGLSCVLVGEYIVEIYNSPKYGIIFKLTDVMGRSYILMHWGNFGGDKLKGYKTHTAGCILLGLKRGWIDKQRAILNSRITVTKFMELMNNEPFKLIIT